MTEDIRNAIVIIMNTIIDIGVVYPIEIKFREPLKNINSYKWKPTEIRGWSIHREKMDISHIGNGKYDITNTWKIKGVLSFNYESQSEIIFDDLLDKISIAFSKPFALNLLGVTCSGVNITSSQIISFYGVTCHYASLQLVTKHKS